MRCLRESDGLYDRWIFPRGCCLLLFVKSSQAPPAAAAAAASSAAGDGCFNVVKGSRGEAQLRPPEPVYLVVYSDGLRLHTLKFCTWDEKVCKSMLNDILDGK